MQEGQAWIPGKRVKLDFGDEGVVLLDGAASRSPKRTARPTRRSRSAWDDWQAMAAGQLDGMTAFMTGKLKVEGDMSQRHAAAGRAGEASELGDA